MEDEPAAPPKPIKFKADGTPDGRGHAEGSKASRYTVNDGRERPGRPKGAISLKTAYARAAARRVTYTDSKTGKQGSMPTMEAIALKQREKALKGDEKATKRFEQRIDEYFPEEVDPLSTAKLMAEDEAILAHAAARGVLSFEAQPSEAEPENDRS